MGLPIASRRTLCHCALPFSPHHRTGISAAPSICKRVFCRGPVMHLTDHCVSCSRRVLISTSPERDTVCAFRVGTIKHADDTVGLRCCVLHLTLTPDLRTLSLNIGTKPLHRALPHSLCTQTVRWDLRAAEPSGTCASGQMRGTNRHSTVRRHGIHRAVPPSPLTGTATPRSGTLNHRHLWRR